MKVLKFGGTSVGSAGNILRVKKIIESVEEQRIIVVSAVGGVTDKLINLAKLAESGNKDYQIKLDEITKIHYDIIDQLFEHSESISIKNLIDPVLDELKSIVKGVYLVKELSRKSFECISGIGERLSSRIIASLINETKWFDSREYIKTNLEFGRNQVLMDQTNELLLSVKDSLGQIALFPGFISSNKNGTNTTLGRGGSDYTAAILAAVYNAHILEIWTDVDGFMTADPRIISRAYCIDRLSYAEAMELSHFGAKVIYPPTILPVYQKEIPILIKNTFNPDAKGTIIDSKKEKISPKQIKGISSIKGISLLTVQGIGMVGVTGISMRLFSALAEKDINVILISQASSENSITIAIESSQTGIAKKSIEKEFKREIELRQINQINIEDGMSVVAIVGENMKHTTGISGMLFNTIGKNGINVYAIAQGASELNNSFVIKEKDVKKAINAIHESFFLSDISRLNLFLVGKGTVGGMLLKKLNEQRDKLSADNKLRIRLCGIAGSKRYLLNPEGISIVDAINELEHKGVDASVEVFRDEMIKMNLANSVFVDCTASEDVASIYQSVLDANISIVTANKIASSSSYCTYAKLKQTARKKGVKFLYETNVGAGLPIISPINDLVKSGDKIVRLEAVLSGTLNFILNTVSSDKKLSEVIIEAKEKGYSEPDPRIDLSGTDVVRKLLILARESGFVMEQKDIEVEPFIAQNYLDLPSLEEFLIQVKVLDNEFEDKRKKLETEGKKLRYVAQLVDGKARVGLIEVDINHPFYDLEGSNNIILINTENYFEHPMQIKGYGAGADVTAIGVFADIIKVANL